MSERSAGHRFLFNVFSETGKLNAMLAVAQHLERRGHEVVFYCGQGDIAAKAAKVGVRARCVAGAASAKFAAPTAHRSSTFTEKMANPKWAAHWLKGALLTPVPDQVDELSAVLDDVRPSMMVSHPMSYAGAIAATRAKVPWAAMSTGFMGLIPGDRESASRTTFELLADARAKVFARYEVAAEFRVSDVVSPWLNITFAAGELFPGAHHTRLVGPCAPLGGRGDEREFAWSRLPDDRPLVVVCFGSHLSPKAATFAALVEALAPGEAFFVVVTREPDALPAELPPHVLVTDYIPQLALLERAAVMVNHGGSNSVMECLSKGVPMLAIPFLYDQHEIARRVAAAGVGAMIEQADLTAERCREILLPMLDARGPMRTRTRAVQQGLGDGAARSCDLLEQLASGTLA